MYTVAIPPGVRAKMERHAGAALPNEACGMLLGSIDGSAYDICDVVLTPNRMESPVRFAIPDGDVLRAYQTAAERGMDVVGVYHSHPSSPAIPSGTDAAYMESEPGGVGDILGPGWPDAGLDHGRVHLRDAYTIRYRHVRSKYAVRWWPNHGHSRLRHLCEGGRRPHHAL